MVFVPRLSVPSTSNKLYINKSRGGYNHNMIRDSKTGFVLPNCVGYAEGRFMEIMGTTTSKLVRDDAGRWYYHTEDGYERGTVADGPRLGAVICWADKEKAGHVGIVEEIKPNGDIVTSNSDYYGVVFFKQELSRANNYLPRNHLHDGRFCQGFIYNPAVTSFQSQHFVNSALAYVGRSRSELPFVGFVKPGDSWSGAFILLAASNVEGMLGALIPRTTSITDIVRLGALQKMGKWVDGPWFKTTCTPDVGDIAYFRRGDRSKYTGQPKYYADHVGIVTEVTSTSIKTVEGQSSGIVEQKTYTLQNSSICGYYKPDWSILGYECSGSATQRMYDTFSTSDDAMFRNFGYLNLSTYTPSIKSTDGVPLSVMNVSPVGALILSTASVLSRIDVNVIKLSSVEKHIIDFIAQKGYSCGVGVGLLSVIKVRSNCKTSGSGLLAWDGAALLRMKSFVGADWAINLSGQLQYIWYVLQSQYSELVTAFKRVKATESDAADCATLISRTCFGTSINSEIVSDLWSKIVISLIQREV